MGAISEACRGRIGEGREAAGEVQRQEADLVAKARAGDRTAFDDLLARHRRAALNLAYQMLGDAAEAEEIAQEAFVRAFVSLSRFRGEASFWTWLHRIVLNLCVNELHRRARTQTSSELSLEREANKGVISRPLEEAADDRLTLQVALSSLAPCLRAVIVLREFQGLSYQEISAALDIPVGTVRSRLHAARERLRKLLAEE